MRASRILAAIWPAVAFGIVLSATPAVAFVACNTTGDCWQTPSKVQWPGVSLMFHNDSWWDEHKSDQRYHFHEADDQHHWQRGYWANGEWFGG